MSGRREIQKLIWLISSTFVTMEMWLRMQVVSWPLQQESELKIISTRCSVLVRPFSLSHSTTCSSRNCMAGLFTGCRCSVSVNLSSTSVCTQQKWKGWEPATHLTVKGQIYARKWSPVSPWRLWVCGMSGAAGKGKQGASLTCCRSRVPGRTEPADKPNLPNVESLGTQMLALLQAPTLCVQFFQHCPPGFQCSHRLLLFPNRSSQISSSEDAFYFLSQGDTSPVDERWHKGSQDFPVSLKQMNPQWDPPAARWPFPPEVADLLPGCWRNAQTIFEAPSRSLPEAPEKYPCCCWHHHHVSRPSSPKTKAFPWPWGTEDHSARRDCQEISPAEEATTNKSSRLNDAKKTGRRVEFPSAHLLWYQHGPQCLLIFILIGVVHYAVPQALNHRSNDDCTLWWAGCCSLTGQTETQKHPRLWNLVEKFMTNRRNFNQPLQKKWNK